MTKGCARDSARAAIKVLTAPRRRPRRLVLRCRVDVQAVTGHVTGHVTDRVTEYVDDQNVTDPAGSVVSGDSEYQNEAALTRLRCCPCCPPGGHCPSGGDTVPLLAAYPDLLLRVSTKTN